MSSKGSPQNRSGKPKRRRGPRPIAVSGRARGLRRSVALGSSVAVHMVAIAALMRLHPLPLPVTPSPIMVSVVTEPKQPPGPPGNGSPGGAPSPAPPAPHAAPVAAHTPHPVPRAAPSAAAHPAPMPVAVSKPKPDTATAARDDMADVLNDSQLAGAANAGGDGAGSGSGGNGSGGGGGGGCDTARLVQQALRRDPLVHTAVEDAHRLGKSVMLWNGDWVRSGLQEGKGMSAVREAIIWEVAFSPEACRNARLHGLVLLSLGDGATRFAIGSGDWRWSDLLIAHGD